jgi:hypothetical protein
MPRISHLWFERESPPPPLLRPHSSLSSLSILRSRPDAQDLKSIKKDTSKRERERARDREPERDREHHEDVRQVIHHAMELVMSLLALREQILTPEELHVQQLSQLPHLRD